jgi:hypothetical protein
VGGGVSVEGGRMCGKGIGGRTCCKYCVHMYVNGKLRCFEIITGMGSRRIKQNNNEK